MLKNGRAKIKNTPKIEREEKQEKKMRCEKKAFGKRKAENLTKNDGKDTEWKIKRAILRYEIENWHDNC